jgi:hypothetical protein
VYGPRLLLAHVPEPIKNPSQSRGLPYVMQCSTVGAAELSGSPTNPGHFYNEQRPDAVRWLGLLAVV